MTDRPAPGTRLTFRWRKWNGAPHWEHDCVYLGGDRWGDWFGQSAGWRSHRPGRDMRAETANVTLLPPSGDYALTLNRDHPRRVFVYIDLAWDLRWAENGEPEGVDMDLDVVRADDGRGIWIDDRDEWDEHRVAYGYPPHVVAHLEALAVDLEARVRAAEAPFDETTAGAWLAVLSRLEP
ncbi:DUF402 domain-containing protein [Microbacterium sp. No. 7]|uniref:DUF402 domain-containing protein n=1 Tax=Microbacterium sp. No. 7 TaxID=1714373 RepID=UPI0006D145D1|nr:DUF402 domain-containing protein [Microbacterium sp. No. 7]ALJ21459.1 hypothetical protein AOA12_16805 [Microbacterium sp. No. 7]